MIAPWSAAPNSYSFDAKPENRELLIEALRIRAVETVLLEMFGKGLLAGTIHTCVGQEFSGVIASRHLVDGDFVTSNHRCHGHFIAATKNWHGLIDEIIGVESGVCRGIGSSQHLYAKNFLSNGQQGGLIPVGAGIALSRKRENSGNIVLSYVGEGTLGEGVIYETFNIASLWNLPYVIICENNEYSQSTHQSQACAGDILQRPKAFGWDVFEADTWNLEVLDSVIAEAFSSARKKCRPAFILIKTYRLNAHSKGDDFRDELELRSYNSRDILNRWIQQSSANTKIFADIVSEVQEYTESAITKPKLPIDQYFTVPSKLQNHTAWENYASVDQEQIGRQLTAMYGKLFAHDPSLLFLGEDLQDPYGGAFKITRSLEKEYPGRIINTPISEAAITGMGIGLSLASHRTFVEIMFADFMGLAFDQILNNAAKLCDVYNTEINCPVVIRTPCGAGRGYGPTHSQSLERFFLGMEGCTTVCLHSLASVDVQLSTLSEMKTPLILFENKVDYGRKTYLPPRSFVVEVGNATFPAIRVRPARSHASLTIVSYGGVARLVADGLHEIFLRTEAVVELIVISALYPLDIAPVSQSVSHTKNVLVVEEGAGAGGCGAEILASLSELNISFRSARLSGSPLPIPSASHLEQKALPSLEAICELILSQFAVGNSIPAGPAT